MAGGSAIGPSVSDVLVERMHVDDGLMLAWILDRGDSISLVMSRGSDSERELCSSS
jgi:hypothetical protein